MQKHSVLGALSALLVFALVGSGLAGSPGDKERSRRRGKRKAPFLKVGAVLPDFSLKDVQGKKVSRADFLGKKILVIELGACT